MVSNILIFETELVNMSNRTWMYNGWQRGKAPSNEWVDGTNGFLNIAFSIPGVAENDTIKCPCAQCRNYFRHIRLTVEMHLCWYGFKEDYETWTEHGEGLISHDGYDGVANLFHANNYAHTKF